MSDASPQMPSLGSLVATSITYHDLIANWETTFDRIETGETFLLVMDGQPLVYLRPVEDSGRAE